MPPKFPSLEELLGVELVESPKKHTGLLYELLGGSPMPIYNDAQETPNKYKPEDLELLEAVVARGPAKRSSLTCGCPSEHWDLTEEERARLDQMVLTFATAARIDPPAVFKRHYAPRTMKLKEADVTALPVFWWLKNSGSE